MTNSCYHTNGYIGIKLVDQTTMKWDQCTRY